MGSDSLDFNWRPHLLFLQSNQSSLTPLITKNLNGQGLAVQTGVSSSPRSAASSRQIRRTADLADYEDRDGLVDAAAGIASLTG